MTAAKSSPPKKYLGEVLVERGLVSREDIEQALRVQVGGIRRLGYILIKMGLLSEDDLLTALAEQQGLPIIKVADEFDSKVKALVPRYLCRRYSVIPLSLEENNVLRLAMINPLDDEAVADVENYTGHAVRPMLAHHGDINRAIGRLIPLTAADFFNPQVFNTALRGATVVIIALVAVLAVLAYRNIQLQRYGAVSRTADAVTYRNHDLMISAASDGSFHFVGRGAYADGLYGVTFSGGRQLAAFVASQERNLSEEQRQWVNWVLEKQQ
jgi:hypothetical protein